MTAIKSLFYRFRKLAKPIVHLLSTIFQIGCSIIALFSVLGSPVVTLGNTNLQRCKYKVALSLSSSASQMRGISKALSFRNFVINSFTSRVVLLGVPFGLPLLPSAKRPLLSLPFLSDIIGLSLFMILYF